MKKALEYIILIFGLLIGMIGLFSIAETMNRAESAEQNNRLSQVPAAMSDVNEYHVETKY